MKKAINISSILLLLVLSANARAMEKQSLQGSSNELETDIALPKLSGEEQKRLADEYEQFHHAQNPQDLRKAAFAIVGKLAHTALTERDPEIEKNALNVQKLIGTHYPNEATREVAFLYNIFLALQKPAKDDRYPFRELYTPVEQLRKALQQNSTQQKEYQLTAEELAQTEHSLFMQIAALQKQLEDTKAQKARQLTEVLMIVQANNTLAAQSACHAVALQEHRDRLIASIESSITKFIEFKEKFSQAKVEHEQRNFSEQVKQTETTIESEIKLLWYCMHYLQRIQSSDGSVGAVEEFKWKIGSIDPLKLGINNYQEYLAAKNK